MSRVYNFAAGPAVLPEEVLREISNEMLEYKDTGMSVMEMSHRSKMFEEILEDAKRDLTDLLNIPDNYRILFLQGGGHMQFAMVPLNLMKNKVADYIVTGQWAKKAYQEANIYGKANKIASSEDKNFTYIQIVQICRYLQMQIMYIFVRTIQYMAPNIRHYLIPKARH